MTSDEQRTAWERDGYVVIRGFLPTGERDQLARELARYRREVVPRLPATHAFFDDPSRPESLKQLQHMEEDPYFAAYRHNARWKGLAESLLGESATCQSPEWFNKPPGSDHPTPPHQDNYYFNLTPPNVVTIWLALDEVDEENGCLRYLPGSHRRGFRPHARSRILGFSQGISDYTEQDRRQEVTILLHAGDAVAHHGMTIHRADPNRSAARGRPAFAMVFRGVSCQRDDDRYRQYEAALREQHQEMGLHK